MSRNLAAHAAVDRATRPSTLQATLNYVAPNPERPVFHTSDQTRSRLVLDPHPVAIRDARELAGPSIDREGFLVIRQPMPPWDLRDQSVRDGAYLVHLQDLVQSALGAAKVITNTSVIRLPGPKAFQVPVLMVHCDFTLKSARRLLGECMDHAKGHDDGMAETNTLIAQSVESVSEADRRYSRVLALNAWRPISEPPHDVPLAVCRRDSLAPGDIQVADFIEEVQGEEPYRDELSLCHYNSSHEWYSFSDMTPDELLLFAGYDFNDPEHYRVMHSAFRDSACPPGVAGRASVEVRMFAFFE